MIANGLFWAVLVLAAAYVFEAKPFKEDVTLWGIVGFLVAIGFLAAVMVKASRPRD